MTQHTSTQPGKSAQTLIILSICALAAGLRFHHLTYQSLWNDELSTWVRSHYDSLRDVIVKGVIPDVHPPGWQILVYYVEKIFGDSEFLLRLPSAIAGVLAVGAIYLLARRLYGVEEAWISALLLACLQFPIQYSQEARAYSLLLLMAIVSTYLWIELLDLAAPRSRIRTSSVVGGYIIAALCCAYLHYFGLLLVLWQFSAGAVITLFLRRTLLPRFAAAYPAIAIGYLPWLPHTWEDFRHGESWMIKPGLAAPFVELRYFFNNSAALLSIVLLLYAALAARSTVEWRLKRNSPQPSAGNPDPNQPIAGIIRPTVYVTAWLLVPFVAVWIKSLASTPVLTTKNLIILLPAAYLLLARAIARMAFSQILRAGIAAVLVLAFLGQMIFGSHYYSSVAKEQFREAMQYVARVDNPSSPSLIIACSNHLDYFNYYLARFGCRKRSTVYGCTARDIPDIDAALRTQKPAAVWFACFSVLPEPAVLDYLNSHLHKITNKTYFGGGVILYKPNPPGT